MASKEVLSERPVSLVELREDIKKIKARDKEINFRTGKVEEYLNLFAKLDAKKNKELTEKINKLKVPRLRDQHVAKIVDLMPHDAEDIKSILQGYTITVSNDNVNKIVKVVNEFK